MSEINDIELLKQVTLKNRMRCMSSGSLYCAYDKTTDERLAVRWLPLASNGEAANIAVTQLPAHPALPTIKAKGRNKDFTWFAVDYPEGTPLSELKDELPLKSVLRLGAIVADALAALHAANHVHGSLCSASILKIGDAYMLFDAPLTLADSMADRRNKEFQWRRLEETALFMSPEQMRGGDPTSKSDVYALGVVLCIASGANIPKEDTTLGKLQRVLGDTWRPQVPKTIPQELQAIFYRMLSPTLSLRPSAKEVAEALNHFLAASEPAPASAPKLETKEVMQLTSIPPVAIAPPPAPAPSPGPTAPAAPAALSAISNQKQVDDSTTELSPVDEETRTYNSAQFQIPSATVPSAESFIGMPPPPPSVSIEEGNELPISAEAAAALSAESLIEVPEVPNTVPYLPAVRPPPMKAEISKPSTPVIAPPPPPVAEAPYIPQHSGAMFASITAQPSKPMWPFAVAAVLIFVVGGYFAVRPSSSKKSKKENTAITATVGAEAATPTPTNTAPAGSVPPADPAAAPVNTAGVTAPATAAPAEIKPATEAKAAPAPTTAIEPKKEIKTVAAAAEPVAPKEVSPKVVKNAVRKNTKSVHQQRSESAPKTVASKDSEVVSKALSAMKDEVNTTVSVAAVSNKASPLKKPSTESAAAEAPAPTTAVVEPKAEGGLKRPKIE